MILTAVDQSDVSGSSSSLVAGLAADGEQLRPQESHLTVHLVDLACDVVAEVSLDADFLRILHQGAPRHTSVTAPDHTRQEY